MSTLKPACPKCGHIHTGADARLIGRYTSAAPYYAAATPPVRIHRATRAEAEADECAWWAYLRTGTPGGAA